MEMPSRQTIMIIGAVICLCMSASVAYALRSAPPPPTTPPMPMRMEKPTRPKKRVPKPTSPPPATNPPATTTTFVYPDYATQVYPVVSPSFLMVPGANFPGVVGKRREEVTTYIMTTFPRLVVRAMPYGSQMTYEARNDRVTVQYDPYTNRVISARIG